MAHLEELLAHFASGDVRAASRLLSVVERGGADAERVLDAVFPRTGRAHRIAITGPGGAGKSTLINELTRAFRAVFSVKTQIGPVPVEIDFVAMGSGRNELTLTLSGPAAAKAELHATEVRLARLLASRAHPLSHA